MRNRLISIALRSSLVYRFGTVLSILNIFINLLIQIAIWKAVYLTGVTDAVSMQLGDMIPYAICSSFVSLFVNTNVIEKINNQIKTGAITIDLIKPISFGYLMFSESVGMILSNVVLQFPVIAIFIFVYRDLFVNCYFGIFFFISVMASMVLYFLISYCVGLVGFWYLEMWHLRRLVDGIIKILSGAVIPLAFFPNMLSSILKWMPLRCLYDIPIHMMLDNNEYSTCIKNVLFQCIWIVFFYLLKEIIYKKGIKKIEVQGG